MSENSWKIRDLEELLMRKDNLLDKIEKVIIWVQIWINCLLLIKINRFDIYQKYLDEVVHFYSLKKYNDSLESYENAI